jgi:hypothetical protein
MIKELIGESCLIIYIIRYDVPFSPESDIYVCVVPFYYQLLYIILCGGHILFFTQFLRDMFVINL